MKRVFLAVFLSGLWIVVSEFVRNEFLFKYYWTNHFKSIGLTFTTLPINGILWMFWSFILAYIIYKLLIKFSFIQTVILSWLGAFVMMWITIYNLQTLPIKILYIAVPLSLLEIVIAAFIVKKVR
jgi:hypothetical protein